jgi:ferredoxin-nitrite reductase
VLAAGDHVGIQPQKREGYAAVGCAVPVGRLRGDDLIEFSRLADEYGSGELRLTNNQNILVVDVPEARLDDLLSEPLLGRYSPQPSAWARRTVSCTGKDFCHFSLFDTKARAVEFAAEMDALVPLSSPLRVHWSGCFHGCGQHQIGDIGFEAVHLRAGNDVVEAVDVYLGGQLGPDPKLATRVLEAVPVSELPERIPELLREAEFAAIRQAVSG